MKTRFLAIAVIAAAAVLMFLSPAQAAFELKLYDGTTTTIIADGGAGDLNPVNGAITWIGTIGSWSINVTTGVSKPNAPNSTFLADLDLNSVNTSTGAATLTMTLTDTDFYLPSSPNFMITSHIGGTVATGGTLSAEAYYNPNNLEFATQNAIVFAGSPFNPISFSGDAAGVFAGTSPFSLTEVVTIVHTVAGTTSFDMETRGQVPEPTTVLLIGAGLMGLGFVRRFRQ